MSRVKSRDTGPERELRSLVWGLGYRYRKNMADVVGRPDLAFKGTRKAIFLHGCFWHRHHCRSGQRIPRTKQDFWKDKFQKNLIRDRIVQEKLVSSGWSSLVVWECELRDRE